MPKAIIVLAALAALTLAAPAMAGTQIIAKHSGKLLDVPSGKLGQNGAMVQQWDRSGKKNQLWDFMPANGGKYRIKNLASGKCLDVPNASSANGQSVQQWDCNGNVQQLWRVEDAGGGWYHIRSDASGKCLDVRGASRDNGAALQQWDCTGNGNQTFKVMRLGR